MKNTNTLKALIEKLEGWREEEAWLVKEAKQNDDGSWNLVVYQATAEGTENQEAKNEEA